MKLNNIENNDHENTLHVFKSTKISTAYLLRNYDESDESQTFFLKLFFIGSGGGIFLYKW